MSALVPVPALVAVLTGWPGPADTGAAGSAGFVALAAVLAATGVLMLILVAFSRVLATSASAAELPPGVAASGEPARSAARGRPQLLRRLRNVERVILLTGATTVAVTGLLVAHQLIEAEALNRLRIVAQSQRATLAESHLWLEEALQGDPSVDIDRDVHQPLQHAQAQCRTALASTVSPGWWQPGRHDGTIEEELSRLCDGVAQLSTLSVRRWSERETSGPGTRPDDEFDEVYRATAAAVDSLGATLAGLARHNARISVWTGLGLLLMLLLLALITFTITLSSRRVIAADVRELQHLAAVVGSSSDAIVSRDLDGTILSWNTTAERIFGWRAEEMIGRSLADLLAPEQLALMERNSERATRGERLGTFEVEHARRDGRRLWLSIAAAPIRDADGTVAAVSLILRDITAQKRAERELLVAKDQAERASRAKTEFVSHMSHELRTPLHSVLGFTDVLIENRDGNLSGADLMYLDRIADNGKHLLTLINQILDLARIEAGRIEPELGPVALDRLIVDVLAQLQETLDGKPVLLAADLPCAVPLIRSDEGKLRQILINLVSNAIKFTDAGSIRVVLVTDQQTRLPQRVDVIDTGMGVPEDRLNAIFRPFEQADRGAARRFSGTGLGLSISKSLAEALGYRLEATSQPGAGSVFTLRLDRIVVWRMDGEPPALDGTLAEVPAETATAAPL